MGVGGEERCEDLLGDASEESVGNSYSFTDEAVDGVAADGARETTVTDSASVTVL